MGGAAVASPRASAGSSTSVPDALKAASPALLVDDSSASGCMTSSVLPVAFRSDRLLVRVASSTTDAAVVNGVQAELNAVGGWSATVQFVARHTFPSAYGGADIDPVVVVRFTRGAAGPEQIVSLARAVETNPLVKGASPDYALAFSGGPIGMWPFGYPEQTTEKPAAIGPNTGGGVRIALYDTGIPSAAQATLPTTLVQPVGGGPAEVLDADGDGLVDRYYGAHAVAIASTVGTLAPQARVDSYRATEADGVATDSSTTGRMTSTLRQLHNNNAWPQIIVAAFGAPACEGLEPVGMEMVTEAVEQHDRALLIASAGNASSTQPFYPAAFDGVVAVGALDTSGADGDASAWTSPTRTGPVAAFSNRGAWVDAWAPGTSLVVSHVKGLAFEKGKVLDGKARVRGTSYAAPYVAALVAWEMAATGVRAEVAWDLIAGKGTACPLLGGGIAVALTSVAGTPTSPGTAPRLGTC